MRKKTSFIAASMVLALATTGLTALTTTAPAGAGSSPPLIAFDDDANGVFEFTPGVTQPALVAPAGIFPEFSPNGLELAYLVAHEQYNGDPNGKDWLVVAGRTGAHPETVLKGPISWTGDKNDVHYPLAWSPNGRELAYGCDGTTSDPGGSHLAQVCIVNVDTGAHHMVTAASNPKVLDDNAGTNQRFSWTPDGDDLMATVIVPETCAPGSPVGETCASDQVGEINVHSGAVHLLTKDNGTTETQASDPDLSPDGSKIVFFQTASASSPHQDNGIAVMDSNGSGEHVIYSGYTPGNIAPYAESLTFSPNGKDILFISYGSNPASTYYLDAYEIAANGKSDPVELTPDTHDVYDAVWTPAVTTCTVPDLKHKTLADAKKALKKAACSLGKVSGPKKHRSKRHIVSQSPTPNKDEPAGTKVDVKLK